MIKIDCAKTGKLIKHLRLEQNLTQKGLADKMNISDKTISKWERGLGCPDVSLLAELSCILKVNIEQMLSGDLSQGSFVGGNMKKTKYYVCPACGNISLCTGEATISCCGRKLCESVPQKASVEEKLNVELIENQWFISSSHPMEKDNYISFVAFATGQAIEITKQYPEWNLQLRLNHKSHGTLLWYATKECTLYYQFI